MKVVSKNKIQTAQHALEHGGVIVFPTETVYGLLCDATDAKAIKKVNKIKGRDIAKTPPLIVSDLSMAKRYGEVPPLLEQIVRRYWPGPLTIVVPAKKGSGLSKGVIRKGTVAMRVSSHPLAQSLLKKLNVPLVATSANRSGKDHCSSVVAVKRSLGKQMENVDDVIDMGYLPLRKPSTIIEERDGKIYIWRQGGIRISKNYVS